MRTVVVVPSPNFCQLAVEIRAACQHLVPQFPFDGSDEPFDAPVLPRASRLDPLLTNPQEPEAEPEEARDQHGFIIRAHELWVVILLHGLYEFLK